MIYQLLFGKVVQNYGFSDLVRQHAQLPSWFPLPVETHHGWYLADEPRAVDLHRDVVLTLVFNHRQEIAWRRQSHKPVAILGAPFIHYRRRMQISRVDVPQGTIAFPAHSGTTSEAVFDQHEFCRNLLALEAEYHPITVSVHYDDLRSGRDKIYRGYGFEVFTAGHRHDPNFVSNLYGELRKYRYSCGNAIGTHLLYAIELGIPYFLIGPRPLLRANDDCNGGSGFQAKPMMQSRIAQVAIRLFSDPVSEVSREQYDFVIDESGIADCLRPEELRRLLIKRLLVGYIPALTRRLVRVVSRFSTQKLAK